MDGPSIITFSLAQGAWKSTKVRPCSDARGLNRHLPPGSYNGLTIQQIAMAACLRWKNHYKGVFLDLSKAFYRCRLNRILPPATLTRRVKVCEVSRTELALRSLRLCLNALISCSNACILDLTTSEVQFDINSAYAWALWMTLMPTPMHSSGESGRLSAADKWSVC